MAGGHGSRSVRLHGKDVTYHLRGSGPAIVLVHGITSSSRTWRGVIDGLAEHHTVLAPDLLGHGRSAKPRGDYSLGAYASGVRDLMAVLGIPRATVVGHSLGGGIAMQFAYQFPDRLERLVLVDSGGLGEDVSIALRAATLPGAEIVLPFLFGPVQRRMGRAVGHVLSRAGLHASANVRGLAEGVDSLGDRDALAAHVPSLLVWGAKDRIIPLSHGIGAHELMPSSRLEVFEGAGHFPFNDDPERFVRVLGDFIAETAPAELDEAVIERLLRTGG